MHPDRRPPERTRRAAPSALKGLIRFAFLAVVALLVVSGVAGGLARAGIVPGRPDASWLAAAILSHAALMICGFLGTVIGIERAVAVHRPEAFVAPVACAAGAILLLAGAPWVGAWLLLAGSVAFAAVNVLVVHRQRASHTVLLLVGALAWCIGNVLYVANRGPAAVLPWWFAFLILTIAAERLEMTRLMPRRPNAAPALYAILGLLLGAAALSSAPGSFGGVLYGVALTMLAVWLVVFDIARRTVRTQGLSRYMAVCLLSGYVWLGLGGLAWVGTALGCPERDAALHAIGLGFIVSMMMAHVPVILPAVAGIRLRYGAFFYLPLVLLHLSLLARLAAGTVHPGLRPVGIAANAVALALFGATVAAAALAHRRSARPTSPVSPSET